MGFPLVVKPANSGSNAGTSIAHDGEELLAAVKLAFSSDNKVVVEKYIRARKLEAAVLGYDMPVCSPVGEIKPSDRTYDPTDFNVSTGDDLIVPADIPKETQKKVQETAIAAFKALGCRGLARADFFLTDDGELLLNKIGTMPGLRKNSVFCRLMKEFDYSHEELIVELLEQAVDNADRNY